MTMRVSPTAVVVYLLAAFGLFMFVSMLAEYVLNSQISLNEPGDHQHIMVKSKRGHGQLAVKHYNKPELGILRLSNIPFVPPPPRGGTSAKGPPKVMDVLEEASERRLHEYDDEFQAGETFDWRDPFKNVTHDGYLQNDLVEIWSRSQNAWAPGFVKGVLNKERVLVQYGIYEKVILTNSTNLRKRFVTLDRRWEIGQKAEVFLRNKKIWVPAIVRERLLDQDMNVVVEYYPSLKRREPQRKKLPQHHKDLRRWGSNKPWKPPRLERREHLGCEGIAALENRENWELKEGASHFKKTHFATAFLEKPGHTFEKIFLYNYSETNFNTKPAFHYDLMYEHYQLNLFDKKTIANVYGFCDDGLWVAQEYFPKGNLQTFTAEAKHKYPQHKKVLPTMLMYLLKSIIDLNSMGIIMCDWKADQWMIIDEKKGILKLNDIDSTVRVWKAIESHLKYCNCPYRFNPFYHKNRPPEGWVNRTWGDEMWFDYEEYKFPEKAVEAKPDKYEPHCSEYHVYLRDDLKLPLEQYWFQAARASEMIWTVLIKGGGVVSKEVEKKLLDLATKAVRIWQPMSMNDLFSKTRKILKDYLFELDF